MTKSSSIREIELKYNITLSSCTHSYIDALVKARHIDKLSDVMINTHQFDLENMTDIERANLKYLVMSTKEVLNILLKHSRCIYKKPINGRLRWLMSYNDFYQICAYKLLLNDGILRFNADYNLECAIHCWIERTAMWQSYHKVGEPDEITVLDKPCSDDSETTIGDLLTSSDYNEDDIYPKSIDIAWRSKYILSRMSRVPNSKIVLRGKEIVCPLTEYLLADLLINHECDKKILSKMMYNTETNKPVSNQIFNKFYKQMMMHIADILSKEAKSVGETFSINESEL